MSPLRRNLLIFSFFSIFSLIIVGYFYWQNNLPLVSPIALIESITKTIPPKSKIVYGFLPYWNLKLADQLHISPLTHLAYFAIDLNADGTLNKKTNKKELEPGWNKFNTKENQKVFYQSRLLGQKQILTLTAMDTDLIESLVDQPANRNNAIKNILDLLINSSYDGLNIDFEYVGDPDQSTRNNFSIFLKDLSSECKKIKPFCTIDIDIFGDTADKIRLWDLATLNPYVDHVIVMAYDYYRKSSTKAGPVAPLTGACINSQTENCLDQDISTNLAKILKLVPSEKILLGIPFYGYEWQTASEDFMANTYPKTGSLATYQRIKSIFENPKVTSISAKWSIGTFSPYLVYHEDNNIYQIQFENAQSLEYKMKLVKDANLGGVAIWALGYETPHTDIWLPLENLNK